MEMAKLLKTIFCLAVSSSSDDKASLSISSPLGLIGLLLKLLPLSISLSLSLLLLLSLLSSSVKLLTNDFGLIGLLELVLLDLFGLRLEGFQIGLLSIEC